MRCRTTVSESLASMLSTLAQITFPFEATCDRRLIDGTTSAAVISLPL